MRADIHEQEVIFLDTLDPIASPLRAKGVGELGLCGVAAAIATAIYNATGIRLRDYPLTLDKMLDQLPDVSRTLCYPRSIACLSQTTPPSRISTANNRMG